MVSSLRAARSHGQDVVEVAVLPALVLCPGFIRDRVDSQARASAAPPHGHPGPRGRLRHARRIELERRLLGVAHRESSGGRLRRARTKSCSGCSSPVLALSFQARRYAFERLDALVTLLAVEQEAAGTGYAQPGYRPPHRPGGPRRQGREPELFGHRQARASVTTEVPRLDVMRKEVPAIGVWFVLQDLGVPFQAVVGRFEIVDHVQHAAHRLHEPDGRGVTDARGPRRYGRARWAPTARA